MEHEIFRFGKMILRDRCSTLYDLASLFPGRRNTLETQLEKSQNALVRGHQLCTQLSNFSRMSRRIASFLMLSSVKTEEVSQNCFVLDAVKFKN